MEKIVVRYYRKGYKVPRGCVVGIVEDETSYRLGYSLYHRKLEQEAGISFTKKRPIQIAKGRALKGKDIFYKLPHSLRKTMNEVKSQCLKMIDGDNEKKAALNMD